MELNQFRDVDLVIDKANDNFIQRQFASQGDYRGRTMTVQVTDNGLIGKVPGLMLNLRWRNQASGLADLSAFECIDVENSLFRIEYPVRMMTPGKVVANIQVIQNGQATHLKTFEMTVQALAGEMTGIVSQAEYGALVAVLAGANKFRTDIEILGDEKADKKALAETDAEVAELDSTKADKVALANTNQQVSGLATGKVDKGGASQVTMGMLSQEVKTAMTGGSVAVVGKDAVSTTNIVDRSVTDTKVAAPVLKATLIISVTPPNYDRAKKTFKFNGVNGAQDFLVWGNGTATNQYLIPAGLEVVNQITGSSAFKLVFDVTSKTFSWKSWVTPLTANEILVTSFRIGTGNKHIFISDFPIYIDGFPAVDYAPRMPTVQILGGGSPGRIYPLISTKNKTLTFPSGFDWIFSVDGERYSGAIPTTGLTIDLAQITSTSAQYLLFKPSTLEIFPITWGELPKYALGHALLGTIRNHGSTYSVFLPFPYLLDGKLFGYDDGAGNVNVSLDAPVKCIHHRGFSRNYPENTEIAYKGSKKIGVNEVEMDLVFTSDNVPVNLHDLTINRTARNQDGSQLTVEKYIEQITYADAAQYDYGLWKGSEFKGQKLMSFEDAILICKKLDMRLHIDRASAHSVDRLNIIKRIMDKHNFNNVIYYGYDPTGIDRIRSVFPDSQILYLLASTDVTQSLVDFCVSKNQDAFCGITAYAPLLTDTGTKLATDSGVEVYVWGADSLDRSQLVDWGVTGISTDFANIQQELLV